MAVKRRWETWAVVAVVVAALGLVGGPFVYIRFIEKPAPKTLDVTTAGPTTAGVTAPPVDPAGTWKVDGPTSGTLVGYRVKEHLFGQDTTAYGRTAAVTGSLTVAGAKVTTATFTADLTTVASDQSQRDAQFQGRIMDTSQFPHASFVLSSPVDFGSLPAPGKAVTAQATGKLTLKATTRPVTFTVKALRKGAVLEASGQIPVTFADYGIDNPSFSGVTTEDHGILEFLLVLSKS